MTAIIDYNKYERARILGARALQLSMGAPPMIKTSNTNPIDVAREELKKDAIPLVVIRD